MKRYSSYIWHSNPCTGRKGFVRPIDTYDGG